MWATGLPDTPTLVDTTGFKPAPTGCKPAVLSLTLRAHILEPATGVEPAYSRLQGECSSNTAATGKLWSQRWESNPGHALTMRVFCH